MPAFETLDPELRGVLGKRIRELGLRLEGSPVEPYVRPSHCSVRSPAASGAITATAAARREDTARF